MTTEILTGNLCRLVYFMLVGRKLVVPFFTQSLFSRPCRFVLQDSPGRLSVAETDPEKDGVVIELCVRARRNLTGKSHMLLMKNQCLCGK